MSNNTSSFSGCTGQIDMSLSNTASRPHFAPHLSAHPPPTVTYPPQWRLLFSLIKTFICRNSFQRFRRAFVHSLSSFSFTFSSPSPQFTLRLNCSNHPISNKNMDIGLSENPAPEKDTVFPIR